MLYGQLSLDVEHEDMAVLLDRLQIGQALLTVEEDKTALLVMSSM